MHGARRIKFLNLIYYIKTIFLSGFDYWASWNETFPELEMAGVGPLEIPLEEGYRAKDWTIQLRWPHEMVEVQCFSDKVTTMDCGGAGKYFTTKT